MCTHMKYVIDFVEVDLLAEPLDRLHLLLQQGLRVIQREVILDARVVQSIHLSQ